MKKGFSTRVLATRRGLMYGNPQHLTLEFTIVEGKLFSSAAPVLSPAERCMR